MTRNLSIDIETYSSVNLPDCGLYKYTQSKDFEILLFAYSFDDEPVDVIDLTQTGHMLPPYILYALRDPDIKKTAYNAAFEWYCINKFYFSPLEQWECTRVRGLYAGYPAALEFIAHVMQFPQDKKKDAAGKALIKKFCSPQTPTQNQPYTRILPQHEPEQWQSFIEYCRQDVVVEKAVKECLDRYPLPKQEQQYWIMDQIINSRGVQIDTDLVEGAIAIDNIKTTELKNAIIEITGVENPNSPTQIKDWIEEKTGKHIESLNKTELPGLIQEMEAAGHFDVVQVLQLRQELAKTSITKYRAMHHAVCCDNRVRGLLQFYGAKTGRWAGRLIQVHNLPRNYIDTLDIARELVKAQDINTLKTTYKSIPDTLSQLIRTAFVPSEGSQFAIIDYSAIEARVIAWLANEQWRMEVFRTHGKIYEASASAMFHVPFEKIIKGNQEYELRQKGKIAELALGYQGSKGALIQMGALKMGLKEEELQDIVLRWRDANRQIVHFWYTIETAALRCVKFGAPCVLQHGISIRLDAQYLLITIPSGRQLFYKNPIITQGDIGREQIQFEGLDQTTKKWSNISTYGGKLVENIVQAVARDCLAEAMYKLHKTGYKICFHIHDEVVIEMPRNDTYYTLKNALQIMCESPTWGQDLPLKADGFLSDYYKKD